MIKARTLAIAAVGLVLSTHVAAQDYAQYRGFHLGADLSSVSLLAQLVAAEPTTIHSRPALIQDLEWHPQSFQTSSERRTDEARQVTFSFYDNQLFRIVIDYANDSAIAITDANMITAMSSTYGPRAKAPAANVRAVPTRLEDEGRTAIARWGGTDHAIVLYGASPASGFRLVVTSPRLNALAITAINTAMRLDERDALQPEQARPKQELELRVHGH